MTRVGRLSLLAIGAALVFAALLFALPGDSAFACGDDCPVTTPKPPEQPPTCEELLAQIAEYQDRVDNYEDRYQYWHLKEEYTVEEYLSIKQTALTNAQNEYDLLCTEGEEPPPPPPPDEDDDDNGGSTPIDCPFCDPASPIVFYPLDDTVEIYSAQGQPLLIADPAFFNSLPTEVPPVNTLLWEDPAEYLALYRLSTGEYQFNYGPDENGYVNVLIFEAFPYIFIYDYQYYFID